MYSGYAISLLFGGYIADIIINKSCLSKTTVRKLFEALGIINLSINVNVRKDCLFRKSLTFGLNES
jgi:hypothetical protein